MTQLKDAFGTNINPTTTSDDVVVGNDTLTNTLSDISGDINDLDTTVGGLSSTIDGLSTTVGTLSTDVSNLKNVPITTLDSSGTVALASNNLYKVPLSGAITFSLPTVSDSTKRNQIKIYLYMSAVYTITLGTSHYINGDAPDLSSAGNYMIYYDYLPTISVWSVGAMKIS